MSDFEDVEYLVLLVFPGFGSERENAEEIVEAALQHLNTVKDVPGMRFACNVSARLEIVSDAEQARERLEKDEDLAIMILHDLDEEEKRALTLECMSQEVAVCHTVVASEEQEQEEGSARPRREWKFVFRKAEPGEPRAHVILDRVLTAPLDGDEEELGDRVGQLVAVLALGVMTHHHRARGQPRFGPPG